MARNACLSGRCEVDYLCTVQVSLVVEFGLNVIPC